MPTWLYFLLGFVILVVLLTWRSRLRIRRIAASRAGDKFEDFRAAFAGHDLPEEIMSAVYHKFQDWCAGEVDAFPVRASDDIGHIYGMVDEDLDDAVEEVLKECSRKLPPPDQLQRLRPIVTVKDFVLFIAACPGGVEP